MWGVYVFLNYIQYIHIHILYTYIHKLYAIYMCIYKNYIYIHTQRNNKTNVAKCFKMVNLDIGYTGGVLVVFFVCNSYNFSVDSTPPALDP